MKKEFTPLDESLNVEEVAQELGITRSTVRRMIISGELPGFTLRTSPKRKILRMRRQQLEKWIVSKEREQSGNRPGKSRRKYETTSHTNAREKAVIDMEAKEKNGVIEERGLGRGIGA